MNKEIRKLRDECGTAIIKKGGAGDMSEVDYFISFIDDKGYEIRKKEDYRELVKMNVVLMNKLLNKEG